MRVTTPGRLNIISVGGVWLGGGMSELVGGGPVGGPVGGGDGVGSRGAALDAVVAAKVLADRGQRELLVSAVGWCAAHVVDGSEAGGGVVVATWPGTDRGLVLAGRGAPVIAESAVIEYAAVLGYSVETARGWLADALELGWRLPGLYRRVVEGGVAVWRARRVARLTHHLPVEAAGFVDVQVGPVAHRCSLPQVERVVARARVLFAVGEVQDAGLAGRSRRGVRVGDVVSVAGTVQVEASLDVVDALDLDRALRREAELLGRCGSGLSVDERRAIGLGNLARRQLGLDLPNSAGEVQVPATAPTTVYFHLHQPPPPTSAHTPAHAPADAPADPSAQAPTVPPGGVSRVSVWLGNGAGAGIDFDAFVLMLTERGARVRVRPVLDLNQALATAGYRPTGAQVEVLYLRDGRCVFPGCTRRARPPADGSTRGGTDADHITPWPQGPTSTDNLAPLCRRHHRVKTHHGWTYQNPQPGRYIWTSPQGHTHHVTTTGPDP